MRATRLFVDMLNRFVLAAATLTSLAALAHDAHAAPELHLGPPVSSLDPSCNGIGLTSQVGYYGEATPRTGATGAWLVGVVKAGCNYTSAQPYFRYGPEISRVGTEPVQCFRVARDGSRTNLSGTAQCSTYAPLGTSSAGDLSFGYSNLDYGETLEVWLPIHFIHQTQATTVTTNTVSYPTWLTASSQFAIGYDAQIQNVAVTLPAGGTAATVAFDLQYFGEAGTIAFEHGPTPSLGSTIALGTTFAAFTSIPLSVQLSNLVPGAPYYWRVRFTVPAFGTTLQATQVFTTVAPRTPPGPPPNQCPTWPCRR